MIRPRTLPLLGLASLATVASAQTQISVTYPAPSLDRWMYPFNFSAGAEATASVFAALDQADFDDRDAQFIVGWNTEGDITPNLPPQSYVVTSATIRLVLSAGDRWVYDATSDAAATAFLTTDPAYVADADAGRPVELHAAGYRNGFSALTFTEAGPFTVGSPFPPRESARNVFAAVVDVSGATTDISNHVRDRFDVPAFAVGTTNITPGTTVPADTVVTFNIDLTNAATHSYFARSLSSGRLRFVASTLSPAAGGPGGGTGDATYPAFYTKENALSPVLGFSPSLELAVTIRPPADVDMDGDADSDDIIVFFSAWDEGQEGGDFDLDGDADSDDIIAFFAAWENG